jgi:hypothetical protein
VLALLLALLIIRLPVIVKIAWYSLLSQTAALSQALDNWDLVGMVLSFAQILILGLQMLGIAYLLFRIGRMIVRVVFKRVAARWFKGEGA